MSDEEYLSGYRAPPPGYTPPPPALPPLPPDPRASYSPPPKSNGWAIASLICSLVGLMLCGVPSLVGVVLGIVGLRVARRTGVGRGLSIAGIAVGSVMVLLGVIAIVVLATSYGP